RRLTAQPYNLAASFLDLLACGLREAVRRDRELLGQLALAENLDVDPGAANKPPGLQRLGGYLGACVEHALQFPHVHALRGRAVRADRHGVLRGRAALLGETHVDRHLSAFEAGAHRVRARARLLTLEAAPGVASLARAEAAADALAVSALLRRLERGQ